MNDPENKDLKPQDDTAEQPTAAQEESDGTELSDEETENIFFEYLQENHPEFQPDDDDYIEVIVTDY